MTTKEAIQAMIDGKKVYRKSWKNDYVDYFYFDGECFRDEQDVLLICDFHGDDWEIYEEQKPVQTVTIEKWLCLDTVTQSYCICEESCVDAYINDDRQYLKKVKLLDTYEVTL